MTNLQQVPYPRTSDIAEMRARATAPTIAFHDYWDRKRAERSMPARRPVFTRGTTTSPRSRAPIACEDGIWPLSSDGKLVDKCAGIQDMSGLYAI